MPVYRKKGRGREAWRVVLWINNKANEWTVRGTKAEATAFEARKRIELETSAPAETRVAPKFSDFCVKGYREHAEQQLKASTWKVRQYQVATLVEHFGAVRLNKITTELVLKYKATRRKAVSAVTVNNELAVLQAILTRARKLKIPVAAPLIEPLPVAGRGRVTFWNDDQIAALYAAVDRFANDLLAIVVFLANTGCRKGEALALQWKNIDLVHGLIKIEPSEEWQPKDNEAREIPISDALRPWLERQKGLSERWVFPSSREEDDEEGRPVRQRFTYWPKRSFDRARKLAGHADHCDLVAAAEEERPKGGRGVRGAPRKKATCTCGARDLRGGPHTLRHTFAAHFLRAVPDMYLLSRVLGHAETRTTALYAHLLPDHLARARNAVNLAPGPRER